MDTMKKYIVWIAVALLVAAGSFFVYKKMAGVFGRTIQGTAGQGPNIQ